MTAPPAGRMLGRVNRLRGDAAEQLAVCYLEARGIRILARNLRCKGGEIDVLGLDGALIAIIEVRQRRRSDFGGPLASVTAAKQRKIIRAASRLLQTCAACRGRLMRFDVIGVHGAPDGDHEISWIKDAFRAT